LVLGCKLWFESFVDFHCRTSFIGRKSLETFGRRSSKEAKVAIGIVWLQSNATFNEEDDNQEVAILSFFVSSNFLGSSDFVSNH